MTNEEIIRSLEQNPKHYFLGKIILTPSDYMNEARKDERDKVIGEIKEIWKKEIFGRYRGVDFVLNEIFLTKLNSLREAK